MKKYLLFFIVLILASCKSEAQTEATKSFKINKTEAEWKVFLTPDQYYILRQSGTERPFSSPLNKNYAKGSYHCAACNTPLFLSNYKFDSGTGWPSFYKEIEGNVAFSSDRVLGYTRTEEHCATCGGHLGHVFNDGPKPTGIRHCINGDALIFKPTN